jgi:hypothetical protein
MPFRSTLARMLAITLVLVPLAACSTVTVPDLASYLPGALPAMRWDARDEAASWTSHTLAVVAAHDAELANTTPADIETFCPHYPKASLSDRRAFWVGLLSATSKHESGYNPKAVGGKGRYIGLMQISPATAKQNQCSAQSSAALKDGSANLACAVQIMAPHVAADGMVAGGGNRGIGRDWGPFSKKSARSEIAAWTAKQSYCQG